MAVSALTAATSCPNRRTYLIPLINNTECDAEADVEVAVALDASILGVGAPDVVIDNSDKIAFHLILSDETGAASFNIDSLSTSHDGVNWAVAVDFGSTYDSLTAAGTKATTGLTREQLSALAGAQDIRMDATVTTLDGSNKIYILAFLVVHVGGQEGTC